MRKPMEVMGRLIGLVKPLAPVMALAIALGVLGFFSATAISALTAYGLASAYFGVWVGPSLVAAILIAGFCAACATASSYAITTSPLKFSPFCGARCLHPCGNWRRQNWREETKAISLH